MPGILPSVPPFWKLGGHDPAAAEAPTYRSLTKQRPLAMAQVRGMDYGGRAELRGHLPPVETITQFRSTVQILETIQRKGGNGRGGRALFPRTWHIVEPRQAQSSRRGLA